jgi:serine/threonine protein kinase
MQTLKEWGGRERNFFEVSTMVDSVAHLLHGLHASGRVHRDLKPENVLYLLHSTEWRLLDLGIAARIGALPP